MTTVIINDKTKAGKALLEYLRNTEHVTVVENSKTVEKIAKALAELNEIRSGKLQGKSSTDFLAEL